MRDKNYVFFTHRGNRNGLMTFQQGLVKICIEEEVFYNDVWETINPNDYSNEDVRRILATMRELKSKGQHPTYRVLEILFNSNDRLLPADKMILTDTLNDIAELTISNEDREDIKNTYMYYGLYSNLVTVSNNILDWARSGFRNPKEIIKKFEILKEKVFKTDEVYNRLLSNLDENYNDGNNW